MRMQKFLGSRERNCTSLKPLRFTVCGGFCLPQFRLNQLFYGFERILEKSKYRYRCVPDTYKYKKVRIYCGDDGSWTRYRVKVVNSCKCKEFKDQHNELNSRGRTPEEIKARKEKRMRQKAKNETQITP